MNGAGGAGLIVWLIIIVIIVCVILRISKKRKEKEKYENMIPPYMSNKSYGASADTSNSLKTKEDETLRCPRCKSTAVAIGSRGYSVWTGLLGSGQTVNRCGKCGYSWKPGNNKF